MEIAKRIVAWGLLALVVLVIVGTLWINWSGARAWAAAKARMEAKGETLDFKSLLPAPLPPETNLFQIQELRNVSTATSETSKGRANLKALEELGKQPHHLEHDRPSSTGIREGKAFDIQACYAWAQASGYLKLRPVTQDFGAEVLRAMDEQRPLAKRLADAARTRPRGEFVPSLRERELLAVLATLPVPGYIAAQSAFRAIQVRALMATDCGDLDAAIDSIRVMLAMSEAVSREPTALVFLVASTGHIMALDVVWSVLEKGSASDAQLLALSELLGGIDPIGELQNAMRREMGFILQTVDAACHNKTAIDQIAHKSSDAMELFNMDRILRSTPVGLLEHNEAVFVNLLYDGIIAPLATRTYRAFAAPRDRLMADLKAHQGLLHPTWMLANVSIRALQGITSKAFSNEAARAQALIAIILERWHLQHGSYPDTLAALATKLPTDPIDGKPMRYRKEASGRYTLWSIGFDGIDNQGQQLEDRNSMAHNADAKGDFVWHYERQK